MKKSCKGVRLAGISKRMLALAVAFSCIIGAIGVQTEAEAAGGTTVSISGESVSIGNDYISREYTVSGEKILTSSVLNKRINKTLTPQTGSEDFVIRTIASDASAAEAGTITSSSLKYKDAAQTEVEGGKKLTINYQPYTTDGGVTYTISQVVVLEDEDFYMRSFLEISVSDKAKARIDYIDTDRFILPSGTEGVWSHPDESKISSMWIDKHELMLGQPIYAGGLFMGSEFPAADTRLANSNTTEIRYYSGKTFARLEQDGQLTKDGKFVTWQNVIGAAQGTEQAVVQTDFFQYIEDIATPTQFRKQYNSWYDNMMTITDESVAKSFNGTEKGLAQNGIEPLDAYVMDDGWNTYYDGTYNASPGSDRGTTPNRTGFWEFNDKFPNELYTSSELADKLQAAFGLWLGPQGGYNYFSGFAQYMESKGTGYVQKDYWTNICVGSERYVENLKNLFIDYQKRFNIDYWKWDGFALRPCTNANHDHMTGGTNNMYFTTDLWEKWTDLFEAVRASRAEENKGLFINATCYVNLSPWLLQWVNTVWVQDSSDTGQLGTGERHQQKIYYRDQVYYQLYKQNQVQFPLKNIYNHDPIYGVSDSSQATTEVFREFLFANAMRGTAFWELYFSPSIMDDAKWKVAADAISWAQTNHEILKNAKLFGDQPKAGVYGYSCWNGTQGIVSFTNPTDSAKTYQLEVTDVVGANKDLKNAKGIQVHPYVKEALKAVSYGDTITVNLEPHETIIQQYGLEDEEKPVLKSIKTTGENQVTLKFDERIHTGNFTINGAAAQTELKDDYRTVIVTAAQKLTGADRVAFEVTDPSGNTFKGETSVELLKDGVIARADTTSALKNADGIKVSYDALSDITWLGGISKKYEVYTNKKISGTTDFTINTGVNTTSTDVDLVTSGDDVKLSVNKDGYVEFKVKNVTLTAKEEVTTVVEKAHGTFGTNEYVPTSVKKSMTGAVNDGQPHSISAVREVNGMLKVYIDGELIASAYDEDHVNEELAGGKITFGDDGFKGSLLSLEILNYSQGYDEVPVIGEAEATVVMSDREGWKATACSETEGSSGDADANAAIDGSTSSWWHSNYVGSDSCGSVSNHWLAVDFGKAETFDTFMYTSRGADANGSIKDYTLELKNEDGTYTEVKTGSFAASPVEAIVDLGQTYTAYGFRLKVGSTQNGQNFASAVEVNVGLKDQGLTAEELAQKMKELQAAMGSIDLKGYTGATARAYQGAADRAANVTKASAQTWSRVEEKWKEAKAGLVSIAELTPVIEDAEKIIEGKKSYTEQSAAAFETAYADALIAADYGVFEGEVKAAAEALKTAIAGLKEDQKGRPVNSDPQKEEKKLPYEDVADNAWFKNYVNDVYQKGLMTGKSKTMFAPDENLVRAQFATILYRMEDEPKVTFSQKFHDVPDSQFYTKAVIWAAGDKVRVVTGYSNGNFGPSDNITREQMALMMYRYAKYKGYDVKDKTEISSFPDAGAVSSYAKDAMEWCVAKGIISGQGNKGEVKRLNPQGSTTRAECATIISRFTEIY